MVEFDPLPDLVLGVTAAGPIPEPEELDRAASDAWASVTFPSLL
jgi:hypothetical protein